MKPFICGNWKMHKNTEEAIMLVKKLLVGLDEEDYDKAEVAVAPAFVHLYSVKSIIEGTPIKLCAQNVFYKDEGAYTGEVSPRMLEDIGCDYCIVGHSERRKYLKEDNVLINNKIKALIDKNIVPILCVGETLEEREKGVIFEVIEKQLVEGLKGIEIQDAKDIVIAYEPVWAIGTGKVATPEIAQEVHEFIRNKLVKLYGNIANSIRILYGGSVKPDNISGLMKQKDINGALVGGASLKADTFIQIIRNAAGG